jgi:hypothetical protein
MQYAEMAKHKEFSFCTIDSIVIDEPINRSGKPYKRTYVERGWDGERYRIN